MRQKGLTILLALTLASLYVVSLVLINRMGDMKLNLKSYTPHEILKALEGYDFNGAWLDSTNKFNTTIKNFANNGGNAMMRVYYDAPTLQILRELDIPVVPEFSLIIKLSDGDEIGKNKFVFRFKFADIDEETKSLVVHRKLSIFSYDTRPIGKLTRLRFYLQVRVGRLAVSKHQGG